MQWERSTASLKWSDPKSESSRKCRDKNIFPLEWRVTFGTPFPAIWTQLWLLLANGNKYDVIVIGGGHNGLRPPPTWPRRGEKFWCWSADMFSVARPYGRSFPGFKFSVCSYVVSLLRPEIIRDLDLPVMAWRFFRLTARSLRCRAETTCGGSTITARRIVRSPATRGLMPKPTTNLAKRCRPCAGS